MLSRYYLFLFTIIGKHIHFIDEETEDKMLIVFQEYPAN